MSLPSTLPFEATLQGKPFCMTISSRTRFCPPDVPTATELGIKDFNMTAFIGLWGPPNLPADIVQKVNTAMNFALADPAIRDTITKNGDSVGGGTPERLDTITKANYKLWGEVAKRNNIRSE